MGHGNKKFTEKHGPDAKPDSRIKDEILKRVKGDELPCAVAFEIAGQLGLPPSEVGKTADLMILRLMKCQLGLFGYKPESKLVTPKDDPEGSLKEAISAAMVNDRLPCKSAWEIAGQFNVSKMTVSGVCEALKIKVKPCQLGAF